MAVLPPRPTRAVALEAPRVMEVDPARDGRWLAFVDSHPDGLIYHHPAWLEVLSREYGQRPIGLACEDAAGQFLGILPLLPTRGLPFAGGTATSRRLSSLPRTPLAGPLTLDARATAALVGAAVDRVRRRRGTRLELKTSSLEGEAMAELQRTPWRLSYRLDLPDQPQSLRFGNSRNHARITWARHRAQRLGVEVRPAETTDDLRRWYALYLETMRWHAVPPRSYRFFLNAWAILRPLNLLQLLLAERDEAGSTELLAGSLFLMFGQTVFYAFNGRVKQGLALRANDAIQWQAIHDACAAGFRQYDLGEVDDTQEGLHEFKSKWGAEPRRLDRYYFPSRPGRRKASAHGSSRIATRLAKNAWRRLPLPATALLGDWLYRCL